MEKDFVITKIKSVITVKSEDFSEKVKSFPGNLRSNELIFHFSGQSTVHFGDQTLEIKPNTLRFLPKGDNGRYDVEFRENGECIDVFFDAESPLSSSAFAMDTSKNEKLGGLFKRLFLTWSAKNDGYYFESMALLYRILSELQRAEYLPSERAERIRPALDIIHGQFLLRDFTLSELADACRMSESYVQRLFRKKYGVPPKKYVIQLKIDHACQLLALGRYTVTQVARLCNFSDVYFFSRQFKAYTGVTPTQFIKSASAK